MVQTVINKLSKCIHLLGHRMIGFISIKSIMGSRAFLWSILELHLEPCEILSDWALNFCLIILCFCFCFVFVVCLVGFFVNTIMITTLVSRIMGSLLRNVLWFHRIHILTLVRSCESNVKIAYISLKLVWWYSIIVFEMTFIQSIRLFVLLCLFWMLWGVVTETGSCYINTAIEPLP